MNKSDIYVGRILRCLNVNKYRKYGETYLEPDSRICSIKFFNMVPTVKVYDKQAILIKTKHGYVDIDDIGSFLANIRLKHELLNCVLSDMPKYDNDLFVDSSSLVPYYNENVDEKINVKKLKKQI